MINWLEELWKQNKKTFIYMGVVVVLLLVFYLMGRWSTLEYRQQQRQNLIAARDSVHKYEVEINGLKLEVFEQKAIVLSEREAKKAGLLEIEYLKKLHMKEVVTNATLRGTIKVLRDSLDLQPETVIITVKDTSGVTRNYVRIPFKLLNVEEPFLKLSAGMDTSKLAWFDLSTPVTGEMSIGYKKSGFMKTEPVGIFTTTNKYLTVDQMDILIVEEPKKFVEKKGPQIIGIVIVYELVRRFIFGK